MQAPTKPRRRIAALAYDASESSTRRRDVGARIKTSDDLLPDVKRRRLQAGTRDLQQNFAVAAWAVRRHLDYVTQFSFMPNTGNDALDDRWSKLMRDYSSPDRSDATGRRNLQSIVRQLELRRTVDGDVFPIKLASGHLQVIEGDRVRDPEGSGAPKVPDNCHHGIEIDSYGRPLRYAVHSRDRYGCYSFERWVEATSILPVGYYDEADQVRGVSPLATAINPLRDLYEAHGYALAKMKVSQIFGLAIFREAVDDADPLTKQVDDPVSETTDHEDEEQRYEVDFGKGPIKLELDPGDKAEFMEANSPSQPFQDFSETTIAIALKSLDIPFSFYDESATNFYGSRAAAMQYERSCAHKRADLHEFLNAVTLWKTFGWIESGELVLPAKTRLADLVFEWVHEGTPWWRPLEETKADVEAIRSGFKTHDEVVRERTGRSWFDNVDKIAAELRYAARAGVSLDTAAPPPSQVIVPAPPTKPSESK
jgi:capsid protein